MGPSCPFCQLQLSSAYPSFLPFSLDTVAILHWPQHMGPALSPELFCQILLPSRAGRTGVMLPGPLGAGKKLLLSSAALGSSAAPLAWEILEITTSLALQFFRWLKSATPGAERESSVGRAVGQDLGSSSLQLCCLTALDISITGLCLSFPVGEMKGIFCSPYQSILMFTGGNNCGGKGTIISWNTPGSF